MYFALGQKITLVPGNVGDDKNLHPGVRKLFFFYPFSGDILFSSLVSFAFLILVFLFVCFMFFKIKSVYSDTHLALRAGE